MAPTGSQLPGCMAETQQVWVVPVSSAGVHSACPLDCDCIDYIVAVLRLKGLQSWEDPWQDLVAEPRAGRLKQGRCREGRVRSMPRPRVRSRVGHSQAGAGHMERPLECAGLHSSSDHP